MSVVKKYLSIVDHIVDRYMTALVTIATHTEYQLTDIYIQLYTPQ